MEEEEAKRKNDLIAVFCGGVLESNPLLGESYRFDKVGIPKYLMKCPPFGSISRNGMRFDSDYNWLMFVIKECSLKATTDELKTMYDDILKSLTDFDMINPIDYTYIGVCTFVDMYNEQLKQEKK